MLDSKEIKKRKEKKRKEHDKHYMNYNPCLFYFHSFSSIVLAILNEGIVLPIEILFYIIREEQRLIKYMKHI
jgi:hypothetical protein